MIWISGVINPWLFLFILVEVFDISLILNVGDERRLHLPQVTPIDRSKPFMFLYLDNTIIPQTIFLISDQATDKVNHILA